MTSLIFVIMKDSLYSSFLSVLEINLCIEILLILPTDQLTNVFNIPIEDRHR